MANAPISKIIPKLAVPTIISMLVTSIYNMADTFFVSQLGTSASGAVGIIFSAMAIIQALAFMIGMGTGNFIARMIGAGNRKLAEELASIAFFTGFGVGLVIAVIGNANIGQLVRMLGSTETIAPYAEAYASYIFVAAPFMICSFIMNNLLRFQGKALFAMVGITTGGVLNMVLDPIFIFGLDMGTAGAALATGLSQFISFCILLFMCNSREECISIHPKKFKPTLAIYGEIIHGGLPSLGRQGIASIATIIMNTMAQPYGDAAIAAMSIVNRFMMFVGSAMIGFGQGYQPVCSYCFGARLYDRVKKACVYCVKVSTIFLLAVSAIGLIFSGNIIQMFRKDDLEVIRIGTLALRLQLLTMPLQGLVVMGGNMTPQSIGYGIRATIVSTARQGWLLIPILLCTVPVFGVLGIQMAQPIADVGTFILAAVVTKGIFKDLDRKKAEMSL
ncbi:MATE family efflux transporter [Lachnospiraceae bacterium AM48-27BH]|nr:MATE family efflux transporter [Lachnospiraceae bacterium AM48-27BH]